MSQVEHEEELEERDPYDELAGQVREDFDMLITYGCLVDEFTFGGHSFAIRTLAAKEEWAAAVAVQPYIGTLREPQAFMAATIGLALTSFDGDTEFHVKLDDMLSHAKKRLDFIGEWDDIIVNYCYSRYVGLDQRRNAARSAAENLSQPNRISYSPSADSSIEQGISAEEALQAIQPFLNLNNDS